MTQYIAADTLKVMNDFIQQTDNLSAIPLFQLFQFFCFSFYSAPESVNPVNGLSGFIDNIPVFTGRINHGAIKRNRFVSRVLNMAHL
ncbi:hypothetical protein I4T90_001748 [Salmonella enterica subsp. enterica serovar Panama]|nr:hypothetical protein [Salmonella enterica subsp. enterica serovar Panama]EGS7544112.1 hypothetical protein [Salmonella enterica subsp. enterica serovar Panama]EHC9769148.1 hypothetical protein [Salmonella enterica subsp. enterica serovar Panama]